MFTFAVFVYSMLCTVTSCLHEPDHAFAIERVKRDILDSLGFSEEPNTNRVVFPDSPVAAVDEPESRVTSRKQNYSNRLMDQRVHHVLGAKREFLADFGHTISFDISPPLRRLYHTNTRLFFYVNPDNVTFSQGEAMKLKVFLISTNSNGTRILQEIEGQPKVKRLVSGWHNIRIPNSLMRRLMRGSQQGENVTFNLSVSCTNCNFQIYPLDVGPKSTPFLATSGPKRQRRSAAQPCQGRCCLRELIIDFAALGWDWVIYPKKFKANYCAGSCNEKRLTPVGKSRMSVNRMMLEAVSSKMGIQGTPSCCVPERETPFTIVFTDHDGSIRSSHHSLKQTNSCRCY